MLGARDVMVTDVVGAAFEQRDGDRHFERLAHDRDVAVEQLVLQGLGAGRNDDLAARQQRGHEISEGFAGAGARLCYEHGIFLDRMRHRARHFELAFAHAKAVDGQRERAVGREYPVKILQRIPIKDRSAAVPHD